MDKNLHQITTKVTAFTTKITEAQNPLKRRISATSPTEASSISKKLNLDKPVKSSSSSNMDKTTTEVLSTHLSQLIEPIMNKFKLLKDMMVSQKSEISEEINRLKKVITTQKGEIVNEINVKVDTNSRSILKLLDENHELRKELNELK